MATQLSQAVWDAWMAWRPGHDRYKFNGAGWNGTVSEVQAGDYLPGLRADVVSVSGTTTRTLTLNRGGVQFTVSYTGTTPIVFGR
ncbi:MAG TPA: hypothetical protein VN213_13660 [Solirubrobacteraceae bacterium]|nr:hypothetical protein [Solirubrobacteraceae bacterium]